jgi:hypothetical protein
VPSPLSVMLKVVGVAGAKLRLKFCGPVEMELPYASLARNVKARLLPATPPDSPVPEAVLVEAEAMPGERIRCVLGLCRCFNSLRIRETSRTLCLMQRSSSTEPALSKSGSREMIQRTRLF